MNSTKKVDRRVNKTKQALHEALMQCMIEKDYHAISVSDVTERANVGRSTFYAHFADKEDLLLESLGGLRDFLLSGAVPAESDVHPALQFARPMFEHVLEVRETFAALVGRASSAPVRAHLQDMLSELVLEKLRAGPPRSGVPLEATAQFIVGGFLSVCIWWLAQDAPVSPSAIDEIFRQQVELGLCRAPGE